MTAVTHRRLQASFEEACSLGMRFAYNWLVDEPFKPSLPGKRAAQTPTLSAERRRALRAETIGLIVIAAAILIYAILRYGTHINWSAR